MSDELYYIDEDGNKQDDKLHGPILNNKEADKIVLAETKRKLLEDGILTKEQIKLVYL